MATDPATPVAMGAVDLRDALALETRMEIAESKALDWKERHLRSCAEVTRLLGDVMSLGEVLTKLVEVTGELREVSSREWGRLVVVREEAVKRLKAAEVEALLEAEGT